MTNERPFTLGRVRMRRAVRTLLVLVVVVSTLSIGAGVMPARAGSHFYGTYTNAWGSRYYRGYVPSSYQPGVAMPLVVGLHGCTETALGFAILSELETYAEQRGFIVVFPEQNYYANNGRCWNWFLSTNQKRGQGEPSLIAGITNRVKSNYTVDTRRTFVTGISAGGAMTVVMGATYPDVFAAIGVNAGCEFDGLPCGSSGGPDPNAQGLKAYQAMGSFRRVVPTIVFHGTNDAVIPYINSTQVIQQWAQTNDLATDGGIDDGDVDATVDASIPGQVPGGRSYVREIYNNSSGVNTMERYQVNGMGHYWSGGCSCHIYGDASGPEASSIIYDFFLAHPKP
jgi:poly(hydroxyalkanoate) depolymerase family esterase